MGTRIDWFEVGSARRFDAATRGGGMREEAMGLDGGAMTFGLAGSAMEKDGAGLDALCAEFSAGNEGGGRLSSSSSSSESSCSLSVNVGTGGAFLSSSGMAFGVV